MNLSRRASLLRPVVRVQFTPSPSPAAHSKSEQHESSYQPAAGGSQLRVCEYIIVTENVEPGQAGAG